MSTNVRTIYAQLGNLFYSVAASEGFRHVDINRLKLLVSKDWVPRSWNEDLLISDQAHFILTEMDVLFDNQVLASEAYAEFSTFYAMHPEQFSLETKNQVFATCEEIAELFTEDDINSNPYLKSARKLLGANKMPVY